MNKNLPLKKENLEALKNSEKPFRVVISYISTPPPKYASKVKTEPRASNGVYKTRTMVTTR